jgi:predicted O-methyltransferase YrrM
MIEAKSRFPIMQDEREIAALCDLLKAEGVRSYLEVGSKHGGALWRVAEALPKGSRIVSVDLPGGTKLWKESEGSLKACHEAMQRDLGHEAHCLWGNSRDAKIIDQVRALGPFDAVLIDGDHRREGVLADWETYGPMCRIVAFHDVAWFRAATWEGTRIDVGDMWNHLRPQYRHIEFRFDESFKNNGIGVLWRA